MKLYDDCYIFALQHVNDLSMRIDLEKTLALAESLYLQVMFAEEKLPNSIRSIMGLPELPELEQSSENIEMVGNREHNKRRRENSSSPGGAIRQTLDVERTANLSTSPDAETLEQQYELGVSQFM